MVAGGGPAGMMAGLLLARAGVETLVLEKHADFLRDFRGDTLHPSTLEVLGELGLLEALLELPHDRVAEIAAQFGDTALKIADFRHLPTRCGFIAMMPQWDFLNFLAQQAARYPAFRLRMNAEVAGLLVDGKVLGVQSGKRENRRRPGHRRGWPPLDRARAGRLAGREPRSANRRAVVSDVPAAGRPREQHGTLRSRRRPGAHQPARVLADGLRDPEGRRR